MPLWSQNLMRDHRVPLPWPLYTGALWLRKWLLIIADWLQPAPLFIYEEAFAFSRSQVLYTLVKWNIADVLGDEPKTAAEAAEPSVTVQQFIGLHEDFLYRVLRTAVNMHFLRALPGRLPGEKPKFANTVRSAVLRVDHPNSQRATVLHLMNDCWQAWSHLADGVKSGKIPFDLVHKQDVWQWYREHPHKEDNFSKAMIASDAVWGMEGVVRDYNWGAFSRLVDVGGAYGSFLIGLLERNRHAKGVLFDQPQVIARAKLAASSTKSEAWRQVKFVGGDFFDAGTIPRAEDGDAFVMRVVLHDWKDADASKILQNIRSAIGRAKAKVVISELSLLHDFDEPHLVREMLDLQMMVMFAAQERTIAQWDELLRGARFRLSHVVPCRGPMSVIEAEPI